MTQVARLFGVVLALSTSLARAATLSPGDIVVSGTGVVSAGLLRVDSVTGAQTLISAGAFGDFSLLGTSTIYALSGGAVVEVDTATGSQRVVSSGGSLVAPSGIAVDGSGRVFVSDYGAIGGGGAIFEIDPTTGDQTVLTSGGFMLENRGFSDTDLEIAPGGDRLILLDPGEAWSGDGGDIWSVDSSSGVQTLLYDEPLTSGGALTYGTTGLGIAPNGDIYVSNGKDFSTAVLKIDAITGETTVVGTVYNPGFPVPDLNDTDIAIGGGVGYMTGHAGPHGLFLWDGRPELNPDGSAFSSGNFNELQIVPIPEPSTAVLCAAGLLLLAIRARRRS